jgi:cell division protein FtsB
MSAPTEKKPAPADVRRAAPPRRKRAEPSAEASPRRRRLLNTVLTFVAIVLMVDALVGDKGLMERMRARRQLQDAVTSVAALKAQNAEMREQVRRLNEDSAVIESIAREELGLIRPGELLFIVRDAKPGSN